MASMAILVITRWYCWSEDDFSEWMAVGHNRHHRMVPLLSSKYLRGAVLGPGCSSKKKTGMKIAIDPQPYTWVN